MENLLPGTEVYWVRDWVKGMNVRVKARVMYRTPTKYALVLSTSAGEVMRYAEQKDVKPVPPRGET